jgi:hypothetical protein
MILRAACAREGAMRVTGRARHVAGSPISSGARPEMRSRRSDKPSSQDLAARPRTSRQCGTPAIGRPTSVGHDKAPSKFLLGPQRQSSGQRKHCSWLEHAPIESDGGSGARSAIPLSVAANSLGNFRSKAAPEPWESLLVLTHFPGRRTSIPFTAKPSGVCRVEPSMTTR